LKTWPFFSYFLKYLFFSKTRQRLLFIAVVGLFISAFSLMAIQGIMGGLQKGLIERSKNVHGSFLLQFDEITDEPLSELKSFLTQQGLVWVGELEAEVMLKHKGFVAPAKFHGISLDHQRPSFLINKDFSALVMGADLSQKLKLQFLDELMLIAPGVSDSLMGEVPRFVSESLSDYVYTELPEVDEFEMWGRIQIAQNLLRQRGINQIRLYGEISPELLQEMAGIKTQTPFRVVSWEKMNEALVWSLNLETKVMLFLFMSMSLLVSIAITSGLLIFFSKIRRDLMSFWILGMAQQKLVQLCFRFILLLSALVCAPGTFMGIVALKLLERYGHVLVPDIFIERGFPVELNFNHILISFFIPFGISVIFSYLSFLNFRKENQSFVAIVRSVG
jgi:lipoprotein-releasing system permease protein